MSHLTVKVALDTQYVNGKLALLWQLVANVGSANMSIDSY